MNLCEKTTGKRIILPSEIIKAISKRIDLFRFQCHVEYQLSVMTQKTRGFWPQTVLINVEKSPLIHVSEMKKPSLINSHLFLSYCTFSALQL